MSKIVDRPPMADRETRVRLLAWSYLDAVQGKAGQRVGESRLESSIPSRNGELWPYGSYRQLEHAMDALRRRDRFLVGVFEKLHVHPTRWAEHPVDRSVRAIVGLMPASIFVPLSISHAAGYLSSEATAFARGWDPDVKDEKRRVAA